MFDDIFQHIIETKFKFNLQKAVCALSPSNLGQDALITATLNRIQFSCDLNLVSNV